MPVGVGTLWKPTEVVLIRTIILTVKKDKSSNWKVVVLQAEGNVVVVPVGVGALWRPTDVVLIGTIFLNSQKTRQVTGQ